MYRIIASVDLRQRIGLTLVGFIAAVLVACGSGDDAADDPAQGAQPTATGTATARELTPILANSLLIAGQNRIGVGFVDAENRILTDLDVTALFYRDGQESVTDPNTAVALEPRVLGTEPHHADMYGETTTLYGSMIEFPDAGRWGVTFSASREGRAYAPVRAAFEVVTDAPQPAPGERIPATRQTILSDVDDLTAIDTSYEPDPALHERTVADALTTGRPLVIAFATPAFCETRFCGPVMEEVIQPLHAELGDRIEFIHIEPFDLEKARNGQLAPVPAMAEWGLSTEPWVFVVNGDGTVAARFEGVVTRDELEPVLATVLQQ